MACEQELRDLDAAIAALDASILSAQTQDLSAQQAWAVVGSNIENVDAKRALYQRCLQDQQGPAMSPVQGSLSRTAEAVHAAIKRREDERRMLLAILK